MKKRALNITDERMLQLIDILKEKEIIRFQQQFCDAIEIPKQNIRNIRVGTSSGLQHFTAMQIAKVCKEYHVNANWIMGLDKEVFRLNGKNNKEIKSKNKRVEVKQK